MSGSTPFMRMVGFTALFEVPPMRFAPRLLLLAAALPATALAGENLMLVLDASGSMWGQINGRSKVEIARETVAGVVQGWNPDNALGLVAYGHRRKGDCADIQTLIPLSPLDATAYMKTVNGLNALGMTPLSAAVQHAAEALKSSEQKATVILVSDGEETCNLDPCAVGAELEKAGVDFTAHVIGFDVSNPQHQAQLRCLAENTGGRYFNARDAAELGNAITGAVNASTQPALPPAPAALKAGTPIAAGADFEVTWSGPADQGDFIGVFSKSGERTQELTYAYARKNDAGNGEGVVSIRAPADAGSYALRYVSPVRKQPKLAEIAIEVGEVEASIEAAASVPAGIDITITARGPQGRGNWVGFAPKGSAPSAYLKYRYVKDVEVNDGAMTITLTPPAEPGEYELRYVINERERVLVSRPITITAAGASVSGPKTAMAGDTVTVEASGPEDDSHWIGFAPAGSDPGTYRDYDRPQGPTSKLSLMAPSEPGEYELRYVLNEREKVIASQPITITAAIATLDAPASITVAGAVSVAFTGPRHARHWIGFVPREGDGSTYFGYAQLPATGESVNLSAPNEAGSYDLVFIVDSKVVTRRAIEVQ